MFALLCFVLAALTSPFKSKSRLEAENAALRYQNAHVERLIGSIRRERLDQMIVFGEAHLRWILGAYAVYYNKSRTHRSLNKDAPSHPILGGLHHQYCRI